MNGKRCRKDNIINICSAILRNYYNIVTFVVIKAVRTREVKDRHAVGASREPVVTYSQPFA